jgi:BlaI family penicillinase repressor
MITPVNMTNVPTISDAEWEVMTVLWDAAGPLVAVDVVDRLSGRKTWTATTVKTLLNRLVKKRAIAFETQGNRYLYRPAIGREQCVRAAGRSFVSRVFGGSPGTMLVHFVTHTPLSPAELDELQRLLARKRDESKRLSKKRR